MNLGRGLDLGGRKLLSFLSSMIIAILLIIANSIISILWIQFPSIF
jgi:hypothetical protein